MWPFKKTNPKIDYIERDNYDALRIWRDSQEDTCPVNKALSNDCVYRATTLISCDCGRIPLEVLERQGEGKTKATKHPSYRLLKYKPNPFLSMTAMSFKSAMTAHATTTGNAYAAIDRLGSGYASALWILDPTRTYPVVEIAQDGSQKLWYVHEVNGSKRKIPSENLLHIKNPLSSDGITGYSMIDIASGSIKLANSLRDYGTVFFANNARPNIVLTYPGVLEPEVKDKLMKSWNRMHQGLDSAHRVAILEEGFGLTAFGSNAEENQLTDSRKFSTREISNFAGLEAGRLNDDAKTSFASREIERLNYLDQIDVWFVTWEQECYDKLLTEQEKENDSHVIEFNRNALLRLDTKTRAEVYQIATGGKPWMLQSEVRALENLPELTPAEMDELNGVQKNQAPIIDTGNGRNGAANLDTQQPVAN